MNSTRNSPTTAPAKSEISNQRAQKVQLRNFLRRSGPFQNVLTQMGFALTGSTTISGTAVREFGNLSRDRNLHTELYWERSFCGSFFEVYITVKCDGEEEARCYSFSYSKNILEEFITQVVGSIAIQSYDISRSIFDKDEVKSRLERAVVSLQPVQSQFRSDDPLLDKIESQQRAINRDRSAVLSGLIADLES